MARRRSAAVLAVALTLPGCGALMARSLGAPDASLRGPLGGVLVDLIGCALILPLPLCLIDLPLSLLAGIGFAIADAVGDRWPDPADPPVVYPTPGAPRVRAALDGAAPAAEVTSGVAPRRP